MGKHAGVHKREQRKLRRGYIVSGGLVLVEGRPGQRAAARAASCTRFARVLALAPCNRNAVKARVHVFGEVIDVLLVV